MCDWRRWIWRGILTTLLLGAFAVWFRAAPVETELTTLASSALISAHPWAKVQLDGRDLTLTGQAPSEVAQKDAAKLALATYDVRAVTNKSGLIDLAEPYMFGAMKAPDGVTLTGNVPDEVTRVELVATAQAAMPGIAVNDKMTLARGAPAGFATLAGFALGQLPRFTSGEVSLNNMALAVNGVTDTPEIFAEAQAALVGALPEGLTIASSTIVPPTPPAAVAPASTTTTLTVVPEAGKSGEPVTITATVVTPGGTPLGSVMFMDGSTAIGFEPLTNGVATLTRSLPDGDHQLSARYVGADTFAPSEATATPFAVAAKPADPAPVAVAPAATTTVLVVTPETAQSGAPITMTTTVTAPEGTPTGSVMFMDGSTAIGFEPLIAGVATLTRTLSDKDHELSARYVGAETFAPSASASTLYTIAAPAASEPVAISPYIWSATKTGNTIVVEGYAPTVEAAAANVAEAAKLGTVEDKQQIGPGAPETYTAATVYGIQSLATLTNGSVSLKDAALAIKGEAPNLGAKLNVDGNASTAAPEGVKVSAKVTAPVIANYKWQAVKSVGGTTLSGFVPSVQAKALSVRKAASVAEPVRDVQVLGAGAPGNYAAIVTTALDALKPLKSGTATLDDKMLSVVGVAPDLGVEIAVEQAVRKAGFKVDITSPAISPYVWKADKTAEGITLTGLAPSVEMKAFNAKKAGNTVPVVTDNQTLANGAPANYTSAIVSGLVALGQLQTGTADYVDGKLTVVGAAATTEIKSVVESALTLAGNVNTITAPEVAKPVVEPAPVAEVKALEVKAPEVKAPEVTVVIPDVCVELVKRVIGPRYVNFTTDSAMIAGNNSPELDEVLFVSQTCPEVRFEVQGHTDSRASEAYNQALSEARAASVVEWMKVRGIAVNRFTSIGYGETKPLADNNTEAGKALNRRIEIRALN